MHAISYIIHTSIYAELLKDIFLNGSLVRNSSKDSVYAMPYVRIYYVHNVYRAIV
jgi:hypothetical protein